MSLDVTSAAASPPGSSQGVHRSFPRGLWRFGVLLVTAALVAAAAWGWHWWRHPDVFDGGPLSGTSANPRPLLHATLHATVAIPPDDAGHPERITLNGARANYSSDSVPVTSTFVVCTMARDASLLGVSNTTTPEEVCQKLRPLQRGTTYNYNRDHTDLIILTMKPKGTGTATLTSIDLDYSRTWGRGGQRGTQHIPEFFELTAR
jgi:hypothetical protein